MHVRRHQDDQKSYIELPLESQLNIDADKLAGIYIYQLEELKMFVPLIKGRVVALHIDEGTTTSRFHRNIRKQSTLLPIKRTSTRNINITTSLTWLIGMFMELHYVVNMI